MLSMLPPSGDNDDLVLDQQPKAFKWLALVVSESAESDNALALVDVSLATSERVQIGPVLLSVRRASSPLACDFKSCSFCSFILSTSPSSILLMSGKYYTQM